MKITRFAPSPTGYLHVGNLRTALIAWLVAKTAPEGGQFILRIDDTDTKRSKKEYEDAIVNDLQWAGINWDQLKRQSDRVDRYEEAKQKLIADGRLYKCFETQEELELRRKVLIGRGLPPIYGREALQLSDAEIARLESEGKRPHWRFKLDHSKDINWLDGVRGNIHFKADKLSDPILIREDGTLTYSLASVVDDIDFGITDIVRGEDHISNSAIHVQLFEALGSKAPNFTHISLLKTKDSGISKRDGGFAVRDLVKNGVFAMPLVSYLITLGSSEDIHLMHNIQDVIDNFEVSKFSKSACNYAEEDLIRLNIQYLHSMPYSQAMEQFKLMVDNSDQSSNNAVALEITEKFWNSIRGNINSLMDIADWVRICNHKVEPVITDSEYCSQIADLLPDSLDESAWDDWIASIKQHTNRSGAKLFLPIRMALTGRKDGPELKKMLEIIGKDKIVNRLKGVAI